MSERAEQVNSPARRDRAADFAARALAYVESARWRTVGYSTRPGGRPSLSAAALATAARYIVGVLDSPVLSPEREALAEVLHQNQNPETGCYVELSRDVTSSRLDLRLFGWAVRALAMLGSSPRIPARFMRRWDEPDDLRWWLASLELDHEPLQKSMDLMNAGVARATAFRRGKQGLEASVGTLLEWLEAHQDRSSGFWGSGRGIDLVGGLVATFHVVKIYHALQRPVPSAHLIARTTVDVWQTGRCRHDCGTVLASLGILLGTAPGWEGYSDEVTQVAGQALPLLAPRAPAEESNAPGFSSLGEAVTRLEALRAAALIARDAEWASVGSWRSAWDPDLWVCDW